MSTSPSFSELADSEPRLLELEAKARAVQDDGTSPFFCSNFVWLPMATSLRTMIGAYRKRDPSDPVAPILFESRSFETAYLHLSRLIPPCRACGCRRFEPIRAVQLGS